MENAEKSVAASGARSVGCLPAGTARGGRGGFTLVELLMVILIIGILVALLVVGGQAAVRKAKKTQTVLEIGSLQNALQQYKDKATTFPPDCSYAGGATLRENRILVHWRKAFPRAIIADYASLNTALQNAMSTANGYPATVPAGGAAAPYNAPGNLDNLDQAEALVFFLGGLPAPPASSASKLIGFSTNTRDPVMFGGSRLPGLFEFDQGRLVDWDEDGWYEYIPQGTALASAMPPYVYFDAATYKNFTATPYGVPYPIGPTTTYGVQPVQFQSEWGQAIPYASTNAWLNPDSFQIVCAGPDNLYGVVAPAGFKQFPDGLNYAESDYDNLTNFTSGSLEDAMP